MKMTRRIFSLVLAMMMLVGTMFAIPAAAHEHDHLEAGDSVAIVYYILEGGTRSLVMPMATCGCSNPDVATYQVYHIPGNYNTPCEILLREYCSNCGWTYDIGCEAIGGCSGLCNSFPDWPY